MRLIDADEVQRRIDFVGTVNGILCWDAHDFIDRIPTIDAEPIRHGKWVKKPFGFECSLCGVNYVWMRNDKECVTGGFAFCPQCGARMDGEKHAQDEHAGDAERVSG